MSIVDKLIQNNIMSMQVKCAQICIVQYQINMPFIYSFIPPILAFRRNDME